MTVALVAGLPLVARSDTQPSYNLYGVPGLIDMPTADAAPDGELAGTISRFGDNTRSTVTFQITPRLSGSFRYSAIGNFRNPASVDGVYYDRSFDLRYQLLTEGTYRPAVAIGFQDLVGNGIYGGEYLVASKTVYPGLRFTGGIGWGRLGSYNAFATNGTRPAANLGRGGIPTYDRWFRGDVATFGGVSYAPNDRLTFKLEYSSDDYFDETNFGELEKTSPWNFGIDYRFKSGAQLSLYHAYGTEIGAQLTFTLNPKVAKVPGGIDPAPIPVALRSAASLGDLGWTMDGRTAPAAKTSLAQSLEAEGLALEALEMTETRATLRMRNLRYRSVPQAIGRAARAMSVALPGSVEEFVIIPTENGIPASAVVIQRSDLEALENQAADEMLARAKIVDSFGRTPAADADLYPRLTWSFAPYVALGVFDPDNPVRIDSGVRLQGQYHLMPNVVLTGSIAQSLAGNFSEVTRKDPSGLPLVRTQYAEFAREGNPAIETLTLAAYGHPAESIYTRFTAGYLERMYAGASAEVLWKPVDSRLALGAEVNYVQLRDYDQLFGVQSNTTIDPISGEARTIPHVNGHVSAYYAFGNGFHGRLDVGRYLAGDYGATIALDREFANGWSVGAYATFTNASAEDFGEGSFDKGIRFTIPLQWGVGTATRQINNVEVRSLTRDGGARVSVDGRLYYQVREDHQPELAKTWGRFWR